MIKTYRSLEVDRKCSSTPYLQKLAPQTLTKLINYHMFYYC